MLRNKTALITGASRGIGRGIALRFAAEGCNIVFTYRSNAAAAEQTLADIRALGVEAEAYCVDAADTAAVPELIQSVVARFGKIDILVNNAGITRDTLLIRMSDAQWDEVIANNLRSTFAYTRAVVSVMMKQRFGSIISLSSVVAMHGNAGQANYAASKAGIIAFTQSVAKEVGARGIRANCIAPGFIDTDMTAALTDDQRAAIAAQIPMRRVGTPDDVAGVALFLASDMSSYVSGQTIAVNGAMA